MKTNAFLIFSFFQVINSFLSQIVIVIIAERRKGGRRGLILLLEEQKNAHID
jgi:hypothetical protein